MRRWWVFIAVVLVVSIVAVYVEMAAMAGWGRLRSEGSKSVPLGVHPSWPGRDDGLWPVPPKGMDSLGGVFIEGVWCFAYELRNDLREDDLYSLINLQVGWPLRSGAYEYHTEQLWRQSGPLGVVTNEPFSLWRHGLPIPDWLRRKREAGVEDYRRIPIRPIWPGFAFNVLLNACVIGPLMLVPGWVVRARRRRRGACVGCGYAMAGLAEGSRCPECGKGSR